MVIRPLSFKRSLVDSISALRMLNIISIMQTMVMGWIFMAPTAKFMRPMHPPNPWWIAPSFFQVEIWEVVFPLAALFLLYATWTMKRLIPAHLTTALVWGIFGLTWTVSGLMPASSYTFFVGIVSLFIAAQHLTMIRFWKVEE